MKIKSKLFLVFALCLAAILAVSLAACNPDGDGQDGPNQYEDSTYTVTFITDSKDMTSISTPVLRDVPSGSRISEPTDADGNKIIPYKRGYTFQFWAKSNGDEFHFASDVITANTTLKATYKANEYVHTPMFSEKYRFDRTENAGTDDENDIYVKEVRADEITLSEAELDPATTTLKSTYASSGSNLPVPTNVSNTEDKFCFWYYVNKDGKPIQFSKWAISGSSTVDELTTYSFVSDDINDRKKGLDLYPMFESDLPYVTVRYEDGSYGGDAILPAIGRYRFGKTVDEYGTTVGPKPEKTGYEFVEWYYETEKTANGVTTVEKNTFIFDDKDENTKPTSPMDAAGAENNFKPVELVLYAKWIKQITIENLNDFKDVHQEIRDLIAKLKALAGDTDIEKTQMQLDEILNASILIKAPSGINFDGEKLEPMFDKDHPFKGTIDGTAPKDATASVNTLLSGGLFGDATSASVFGYNEGTIKNLDFENIGLAITGDAPTAVKFGVITTDNSGTIEQCTVTVNGTFEISGLYGVTFGGITAVHHGTTLKNGVIKQCRVKIVSFTADCKALTFGGVAGDSGSGASIADCTVELKLADINCEDDGIASNGKSSLVIGGVAGLNSGAIRLCKIDFRLANATSLTEFVYGGAVGSNNGSVRTSYAIAALGEAGKPVSTGGSISYATCIGGLIGRNGGYVLNSYANANLYVQVAEKPASASDLFVGGLVGSNYSTITDSQDTITDSGICAINYSYSIGNIDVKVNSDIKTVSVYAGGIAGRNSHKKVASLFSTVAISVANDGNSYLGHIFGKRINGVSTGGKIFYDSAAVIKLVKGGNNYEITGDGKDTAEFVSFENVGEGTDAENFKSAGWVLGADGAVSQLGFGGTTWEVKENEYPSFKSEIYEESKSAAAPDSTDNN